LWHPTVGAAHNIVVILDDGVFTKDAVVSDADIVCGDTTSRFQTETVFHHHVPSLNMVSEGPRQKRGIFRTWTQLAMCMFSSAILGRLGLIHSRQEFGRDSLLSGHPPARVAHHIVAILDDVFTRDVTVRDADFVRGDVASRLQPETGLPSLFNSERGLFFEYVFPLVQLLEYIVHPEHA